MKRIAAITVIRNDNFFLNKWINYYGKELGKENLFVWMDGLDQIVPDFCEDVFVQPVERMGGIVHKAEKIRLAFLSARAAELFEKGYDMVIGCDADEFLIVDPKLNMGLGEFLSQTKYHLPSISGLGVDVGQNLNSEEILNPNIPFLQQRKYAKLSTRYSKTTVLTKAVEWGAGFHRTRKYNFHIIKDLYLFHFGSVDLEMIKAKMKDKGMIETGRSYHLQKRAKTIYQVSDNKVHNWEKTVGKARIIQNIIRPPYAWNKPAMFEAVVIVKIPERFAGIV